MAEMIPPYIHKDIKSSAEKKIFELIKKDLLLSECTCFHSLGLARHQNKIYGEIDFVLLSEGGIFCLEVKGGGIKREKGVWVFSDRYGKEYYKREGPFSQVSTAMFSLKEDLEMKFGSCIKSVLMGYGVIFPDIEFIKDSPEWNRDIIYDLHDRIYPFSDYIKKLLFYWRKKYANVKESISKETIEKIRNYIRGDFEIIVPLWMKIEETEKEILELTKNQYRALDRMAANPRVFFRGPAGTGKTLLVLEQAKRISAQNKKVLILCFNSLLGEKLENVVKGIENYNLIHARTIHRFFYECIKKGNLFENFAKEIESKNPNDVYNKIYPKYFIKSLESGKYSKYDCLIVDEGQDILRENFFLPLDFILEGGLEHGQWYIFYDSNNQGDLYRNFDANLVNKLRNFGGADYYLDINCRNSKPIAIQTAVVSGFDMAETTVQHGTKVVYLWYKNLLNQKNQITDMITKLIDNQGVSTKDITILYPGGSEKMKESLLEINLNVDITELTAKNINYPKENTIYICSIQTYKGLENKVIVIAGINQVEGNWIDTLNYIGMSRARELLYVFIDEIMHNSYENKVKKYLERTV